MLARSTEAATGGPPRARGRRCHAERGESEGEPRGMKRNQVVAAPCRARTGLAKGRHGDQHQRWTPPMKHRLAEPKPIPFTRREALDNHVDGCCHLQAR